MLPTPGNLEVFIDRALEEDSVGADVTTHALIPQHLEARAFLVPKEPGILHPQGDPLYESHALPRI